MKIAQGALIGLANLVMAALACTTAADAASLAVGKKLELKVDPKKMNEERDALWSALQRAHQDSELRIVVLQGAAGGPNAQSAKVDATFWIETVKEANGTTRFQLQYTQTVLLKLARRILEHGGGNYVKFDTAAEPEPALEAAS